MGAVDRRNALKLAAWPTFCRPALHLAGHFALVAHAPLPARAPWIIASCGSIPPGLARNGEACEP
jgi:hypothetical protein